ncbi:XrtA system polysaccharide deacetylase [Desulfosediminicola sp.]|uniref:XrtA system polysaccharide deacetylase n=1 Tax=Desulfosediminicola sp. TaxID=2886825 RepID=UPI003AF2689E
MGPVSFTGKNILLTFDVEDWFQVENFKSYIDYSSWPSQELRVGRNTHELLNLLDDFQTPVQATFFILGWVAERRPDLVREIHSRGHEVASHGYAHQLCYELTEDELRQDLITSKKLLEDIVGHAVSGYRAPSFSISDEALSLVRDAGYLYDSSYNSYEGHGRYGSCTLPKTRSPDPPLYSISSSFHEIPVSNLRIGRKLIPWGGGGYFRLLPGLVHQVGVKHILRKSGCYTFYMHPWEIDPEQPRVKEAKASYQFRHYVNLKGAKAKLKNFVRCNRKHRFLTCSDFVLSQKG